MNTLCADVRRPSRRVGSFEIAIGRAVALWLAAWLFPAWCAHGQSPHGLSLLVSNGAVRLKITADVGNACLIHYATNLSRPNPWQFLTNLIPLPGSPCLVADPGATTPVRFYRAFVQQVPTNVVTTNMVWVPPGTFVMGSPANEALRNVDELQHTVTLTRGFFMGKYPVTQGDYQMVTAATPSKFQPANGYSLDTNRPVEQVSWNNASNYCWRLTSFEQFFGRIPTNWVYRLPTESEWEFACRAETRTAFHFGNALSGGMANFSDYWEYDASIGDTFILHPTVPYVNQTTNVYSYPPNAWGLYDVHGDVWEWCQDWYGPYPAGGTAIDPPGAPSGLARVMRGGCWQSHGDSCRAAVRASQAPTYYHPTVGFRVVLAQMPP